MEKKLNDAMKDINKKYGSNSIMNMSDEVNLNIESISTNCVGLDHVFGCGGLPRGRMIEIFGEESCLAGDTFISYAVRDINGKNQNTKGGTIKRLHDRFNNIKISGRGNYQKKQTIGSNFYISSINKNNAIIKNRVLDVVFTGIKECFKVTTIGGYSLTCTKEHRFYIGDGNYSELKDISVGSIVYVDNNTTVNGDKLNFVVTEDVIKSIKPVGKIPTYDIKCAFPYNNYIANKIVVHNSGKTTMAMFIIGQVQKKGGTAVFVDAEFAFSEEYAKKVGIDTRKLIVSQPTTGEEALDIIDTMAKTSEIDVIVLDSVAALVPKKELEGEIGDVSVAQQARLMSKAMRIIAGNVSKTKTSVIFINQTRDKVGIFFGNKQTTSGGKALKFFSSVRLEVKKGKKIIDKNGDIIGNGLSICAVKNKVGLPWRKTNLDLIFEKGIDLAGDLLDNCEIKGFITKNGNTYMYGENKLGVGRDTAKAVIEKDEKLFNELKSKFK